MRSMYVSLSVLPICHEGVTSILFQWMNKRRNRNISIPNPRGSELPLWYPVKLGSFSVPQLLKKCCMGQIRNMSKEKINAWMCHVPTYCVSSMVAFFPNVHWVRAVESGGAVEMSCGEKELQYSLTV